MDFEIFSPHIYKTLRRGTSAPSLRTIDMIMCCLVGAVTLVKRAIIIVIACEATMYWQLAVLNRRNPEQKINSTIRGRNQSVTDRVMARMQQNRILNLHNFPQFDTTSLDTILMSGAWMLVIYRLQTQFLCNVKHTSPPVKIAVVERRLTKLLGPFCILRNTWNSWLVNFDIFYN